MMRYIHCDRISFRCDALTNFYLSELFVPFSDDFDGVSKTDLVQRAIRAAYNHVYNDRTPGETQRLYRQYLSEHGLDADTGFIE